MEPENDSRHWTSRWIPSWLMMVVLDDVLVFRLFKFGNPDDTLSAKHIYG
jgi:hypothetical protein